MKGDQYIVGIGGLLGHDANVALFKNNTFISSSQEERFTITKHEWAFPTNAINDCLQAAGINYNDINVCVFSEKPFYASSFKYTKKQPGKLIKIIGSWSKLYEKTLYESKARALFKNADFFYSWHHATHFISGFHSSDFTESTFLCIDGKSENSNASLGYIDDNKYELAQELEYDNGLGMFYTLVTHFLGFPSFGSEYKIMGLAPYGEPVYVDQLYSLSQTDDDGAFRLKFNPGFNPNSTKDFFYLLQDATGVKPINSEPLTQSHVNLASSIQKLFEIEILKMAQYVKSIYPDADNLVFCGGCAQNCVAAGLLRDSGVFKKVFTSPIGGDMGSAIGACLDFMRNENIPATNFFKKDFYFGSHPGQITDPEALKFEIKTNDIVIETATLLADGAICGWIQDGMELGARALGARSILANPLDPEMQTKLNLKIKFRESFRPFAPIVLEEEQSKWFDSDEPSYYMQYTAHLREELRYSTPDTFTSFKERLNYPRCKVPSIVHVDYSARLQTISDEVHPKLYKLLTEFNKITGVPILINTSFNVNGQPIVRTADEAWQCFRHTDIDYLIVGEKLYKNPGKLSVEEKITWLRQFEGYSK